jgi:uncharacterized protein YjbI with pentapeptide repeats
MSSVRRCSKSRREIWLARRVCGAKIYHTLPSAASGLLDGADLENVILLGADLTNCSFARCNLKNANLAYSLIDGARFDNADLEGADLLYTNVKRARFDGAMIGPTTTIPGIYTCGRREW